MLFRENEAEEGGHERRLGDRPQEQIQIRSRRRHLLQRILMWQEGGEEKEIKLFQCFDSNDSGG